ncbi:hypothetical protein CY35_02G104800 [Sphagnum magellanicum]|jgi:protein transporter SFT1|nr:hypothetical protein CY35_02G104800 [Sphagnum magellanicum]KAH9571638.1 hypothetical protein CY35_02G104800 [Sphagnum magellanicum]KAH9571639.1 hypothetical protein CY35_02G104800 [Sphagnum magellanicum]KAH9571640.1 hypothetical protein CY35_02G104800 [Sphagnum magellanicum]
MAYYSSVGQRTRTYPPNDQVQLRVDPIHGDLDEEVHGLHGKVVQLKQLAQHIESETKFQNELLNQLEATVAKAQAGLKSTMRRLNRNLAQRGLSPVVIVVLFALFCFFCVFLWSKFQRRR